MTIPEQHSPCSNHFAASEFNSCRIYSKILKWNLPIFEIHVVLFVQYVGSENINELMATDNTG